MSEEITESTTDESIEVGGESLLDNQELSDGEYFLSEGVKGVGDTPEWYQGSRYKSVAEQAKAYTELEKKFGSFKGSPKDGYQLPEGVESGDALVDAVLEFGKDSNLNQDGMDKLLDLALKQSDVTSEVNQESELKRLGDNAAQRIKTVENYLVNAIGSGEQYEAIRPLVKDADSIQLVEAIIKATSPKKLPIDGGESPTGTTWADIEAEMFKKDDSGQLLRSVSIEHERKVQKMMAEYGGGKQNIQMIG